MFDRKEILGILLAIIILYAMIGGVIAGVGDEHTNWSHYYGISMATLAIFLGLIAIVLGFYED